MQEFMLTAEEARVLGCLMEKQRTTPDQYPLTLNALVSACNQKTSRHPVMRLTPGQVGHTVGQLRDRGLIHASFSGRTERYDHKLAGTFLIDRRQQALLCALMLRGPQTPGELRTNAARLADFDSLDAIHTTLSELARHEPPLIMELPRQAGTREQRYAHLLCGEPDIQPATAPGAASRITETANPGLEQRVTELEQAVAALREELKALKNKVQQ